MWILIWRLLMLAVAVALLVAAIYLFMRLARGSKRQSEATEQAGRSDGPDISDAQYKDVEDDTEDSDGQ